MTRRHRQRAAPTTQRWRPWLAALVAALSVCIAALWLGQRSPAAGDPDRPGRVVAGPAPALRAHERPSPTDAEQSESPPPGAVEVAPGINEITPPPGPHDPEAEARFRERMRRAGDEYQELSTYPPWSRPFDESQRHLLDWNPPSSHEQAVAHDEEEREIRAEAVLDRVLATPGEAVSARVTAWRVAADGSREVVPYAVRGEIRAYDEARSDADDRAPATSRAGSRWRTSRLQRPAPRWCVQRASCPRRSPRSRPVFATPKWWPGCTPPET